MPALFRTGVLGLVLTLALSAQQSWIDKDVPYVPTPQPVVEAMLKLAGVKAGDVVYDLGCGDGRIVVAAAKLGAKAWGFDIDPERIAEAEANAKAAGVADRAKFVQKNLFDVDLKPATVVTLYLLPDVNLKLRPKLQSQLKPGSRVVSHTFSMGDWEPDKEEQVEGRQILIWTIREPAAAAEPKH